MRGYSDASGLTFTKAMELAQAAEAADKNAQDLEKVNSTGIHKVYYPPSTLAPAKPTERTFKEIVDTVQAHHQPKLSVIMEWFNFHSHTRQTGESVSTFISELRRLSEHCDFGDTLNDNYMYAP